MKKYFFSIGCAMLLGVTAFAQDLGVDYFRTEQYDKAEEIFKGRLAAAPAEANYYLGEMAYIQGDKDKAKSYYTQGLAAAQKQLSEAQLAGNDEAERTADKLVQLNSVGLAQFEIAANKELGLDNLKAISKTKGAKKNVEVLLAIAKVYYANGMTKEGDKMVANAEKADKSSPLVYLFRGDMLMAQDKAGEKVGEAAGYYEQALLKNDKYLVPYIRIAQIYVGINPQIALTRLYDAEQIDSTYPLVKRYQAKANYTLGAYKTAIALQKQTFDMNTSTISELTDYAASLFFNKDYAEAASLIDKGFEKAANDFVLNRLKMYSENEMLWQKLKEKKPARSDSAAYAQYNAQLADGKAEALSSAKKFFALKLRGHDKYIPRDYAVKGNILAENGLVDSAVAAYNKAIRMHNETTNDAEKLKVADFKNMAESLIDAKYPALAAYFNGQYIEELKYNNMPVSIYEYYTNGRYYYLAAQKANNLELKNLDSATYAAKTSEYLLIADSIFRGIIDSLPDSDVDSKYQPMLFRARIQASYDPTTTKGLAKPYYEAVLNLLLAKGEAKWSASEKRDLSREIYRYMAYYYYLQFFTDVTAYNEAVKAKDNAKAKELNEKMEASRAIALDYCNKVLAIAPTNSEAQQLAKVLTPVEEPAPKPKSKSAKKK